MAQKKALMEILNETMQDFQESSKIVDFALLLKGKIILPPKSSNFEEQNFLEILEKLRIEDYEYIFQKGIAQIVHLEFENDIIYYLRGSSEVELIARPPKEQLQGIRAKLLNFIEQLNALAESIAELSGEGTQKVERAFSSIDTLIDDFQIPKFEKFKNLVKFAAYFSKKQ